MITIRAEELLRSYNVVSLQQMAKRRGLPPHLKTKEALIAALSPLIYDPVWVKRSIDDLTPVEQILLTRIQLAGGELLSQVVKGALKRQDVIEEPVGKSGNRGYYDPRPPAGSVNARGSRIFEDVVARLGVLGLLFTRNSARAAPEMMDLSRPGRLLFIPGALLDLLPMVEILAEPIPEPARIAPGNSSRLLRDLYLLLSLAAREPLSLTNRGGLAKRALVKINNALTEPDDLTEVRLEDDLVWISFLRAMAVELGLLGVSVGELVIDSRAAEFLRLPVNERRSRLFAAYSRTSYLSELHFNPVLTVTGKLSSIRSAPPVLVEARQRVIRQLAALPVNEWISIQHFVNRMRLVDYDFLLSRRYVDGQNYYGYGSSGYHVNPYSGANSLGMQFSIAGSESDGWDQVEAEFIFAVISLPLHHLGVIDLGGSEALIEAIRVTEDGGRLFRGEALPLIERQSNVVVQPNFQIFAFEPTGEDILFTLDQCADRVRTDQAIEYELSRDSIHRGLSSGFDTAGILSFLSSVSTVPIPQNVRRTIEEWGGQVERITLKERAAVIQVADPEILNDLYADTQWEPFLGRRVTPTVALVNRGKLRQFSDRLLDVGKLPVLTEGKLSAAAVPVLTAGADGVLSFAVPVPSLFDLAALRPFTEIVEERPKLTAESLRRAAKHNLPAESIIGQLEMLQGSALSDDVAAFIRRWAKDWGSGALFESTLLQVDQASTLDDLLSDPQIRSLLQPLPGVSTIALVRPEGRAELNRLLSDRGMSLSGKPMR